FKKFENSDGLLEKLESWVFVEWSKANQFVQDVNYPSNMLYTAALETASRLYGVPELTEKARTLQETIRRQSYDGQFFVDNALRKDNTLERTTNRSEVCQYFAFFFHVATPESHPELWRILREEFGPKRKDTQAWPEIHPANAFVGNMLRLELLSRHGFSQQILDESIDYLLYMASRTGTLWENIDESASLNHGFASHIVHTLLRDVLGMRHVDAVNHRIDIVFPEVVLPSCSGVLPLPGGATLALSWRQEGDTLYYSLDIPPGYTLQLRNSSGKNLQEQ
ncbi:MAG: hypothetical protein HYZ00_05645, partial [Candidatus Hydrogenedentes bacterium]|nr:hypothetical protein [Candidatus Hydrogenedentota bacterium]